MDATQAASKTIAELAMGNQDVSTLVMLLDKTGLVPTFQAAGEFTVLAPTNEAFKAIPQEKLDELLNEPDMKTLKAILTYHVIPKVANAATVMSMNENDMVPTLNGAQLKFHKVDGQPVFEDAKGTMAHVVDADMMASNGVVHAIDKVLMPM